VRLLVTGGASGLGRAIALGAAERGAKVVVADIDKAGAETVARTCGGRALVVDLIANAERAVEDGARLLGGLDVLVNNAGMGIFRHVREVSLDEWKRTMETNLFGAFYCSREALFRFGTTRGGYIVNIGSMAGANAFAGGSGYNASKFGLTGFTEAMLQDVRSENVRVSYVMPGSVATEFGGRAAGDGANWKIWPEDVAKIVQTLLTLPARTLVSRVEVRPAKPKS